MCRYKPSTLGLTALLRVLEINEFHAFSEGMLTLIMEHEIPFDLQQVDSCKSLLENIISESIPSNSPIPKASQFQTPTPQRGISRTTSNYQSTQGSETPYQFLTLSVVSQPLNFNDEGFNENDDEELKFEDEDDDPQETERKQEQDTDMFTRADLLLQVGQDKT